MSRYIEEEAIIKAIDESGQRYGITTANQCNFKEIVRKTPTADVVPKSEVEKLQKQLAEMLVSEQTELHIPMEYFVRVRTEHPIYTAIKTEIAREILEEIEKHLIFNTYGIATISNKTFAELKKKYTEKR